MQSAEASPALRDLSKAPKYSSGSYFPIKGKKSALAVCTFLMIQLLLLLPAKHIHRKQKVKIGLAGRVIELWK